MFLLFPLAVAADPVTCQGGAPMPVGDGTVVAYACGNTAFTVVEAHTGTVASARQELAASTTKSHPGAVVHEETWTLAGAASPVDVMELPAPRGAPTPQYAWTTALPAGGYRTVLCRPPAVDSCRDLLTAYAAGTLVLR
jgi:hypothetical protein